MKKRHYCSQQQSGYVLLLVMLLIGSLGLYLTYEVSTQKIKTQSWQLQKTATEMSYWMDTEYNYATDQGIISSQNGMNSFSLIDLITNNYLPYGQSRYATIPSASISQVSEFMCSPLPGITGSDGTLQLTPSNFNVTCPTSSHTYNDQHCSITPDTPAYYSCSTTMSKNTTQNIAKAQYYTNANNIAIGNLINTLSGLGLIIRTPGSSNPYVTPSSGPVGQMGVLPNNSIAQSLISLLPTSSFNLYATNSALVNGIGIGTYLYNTSGAPVIKNDRYSKIIDMGLVQAVNTTKPLPINTSTGACCGWNVDGTKTGSTLYDPNNPNCNNVTLPSASAAPPMCIQVDTTKFGPNGSVERCDRIDVLYTMFSDWQTTGTAVFWYLDYINTSIKTVGTHQEIYLSMHINDNAAGGYLYSHAFSAQSNYLAYLVRCTRNNIP